MGEYLETRSGKSILSNTMCHLLSIFLKNNYFESAELKYHRERGFAIDNKFTPPYSNFL